jgi:hypothetical protein
MKVQQHINTSAGGYWYRCRSVEFIGDTANWELSPSGRYSFFEAYAKTPHRQLLDARSDIALRAFVKAWGPLRVGLDAWTGSDRIERYRIERDSLTATVKVLASAKDRGMQRSALSELLEIRRKQSLDKVLIFHLCQSLGIPNNGVSGFDENFRQWLESATSQWIETATFAAVQMLGGSPLVSPRFFVERSGRRSVLKAELALKSLSDALSWMVWQDIFQDHPYQFCAECRVLFQPDSRREKKYCSPECAHRKTAREWQQRKRKTERRTNGTHKTR